MKPEQFHASVSARPGILKQLENDADKMAASGDRRRVLFCFTSDPYQPLPDGVDVTREALQIMVDRGLNFEVCTKGGLRAERDFDLLQQGGRLGVSLVWNSAARKCLEPRAASVFERRLSLQRAHRRGIETWLSVEPVIDPAQALEVIGNTRPVVDEFRVGKINSRTIHQIPVGWQDLVRSVNWQAFVDEAYSLLSRSGRRFMFKESLHPYLHGRPATGGPEVTP
jgi:hypothetical protein